MSIGFSTGSIARGDFRAALAALKGKTDTVELSALREEELQPILDNLPLPELAGFTYISFHAPSKLVTVTEQTLLEGLIRIAHRGWHIIVHPDIITDWDAWSVLGSRLCIENMDKRKALGRTASSLQDIFSRLPEATFCMDLAHARQVDSTMGEAMLMLREFGGRLVQLHVSGLNSASRHEPLNLSAIATYQKLAPMLPADTPVILESPVREEDIAAEIKLASYIFDKAAFKAEVGMDFSRTAYYEFAG